MEQELIQVESLKGFSVPEIIGSYIESKWQELPGSTKDKIFLLGLTLGLATILGTLELLTIKALKSP